METLLKYISYLGFVVVQHVFLVYKEHFQIKLWCGQYGSPNNVYSYITSWRNHYLGDIIRHIGFIFSLWVKKRITESVCRKDSLKRSVQRTDSLNASDLPSKSASSGGPWTFLLNSDWTSPALQKRWRKPWQAWNTFKLIRNTTRLEDLLKISSSLSF